MAKRWKGLLKKHTALMAYLEAVCTPDFEVDETYSTYGHLEDGTVEGFEGRFVDLARDLEAAGLGTFKLGRRGYPSRFEWGQDLRELALEVVGEPKASEAAPEQDSVFYEVSLPHRRFAILNLPNDVSEKEVEIVVAYLRALI